MVGSECITAALLYSALLRLAAARRLMRCAVLLPLRSTLAFFPLLAAAAAAARRDVLVDALPPRCCCRSSPPLSSRRWISLLRDVAYCHLPPPSPTASTASSAHIGPVRTSTSGDLVDQLQLVIQYMIGQVELPLPQRLLLHFVCLSRRLYCSPPSPAAHSSGDLVQELLALSLASAQPRLSCTCPFPQHSMR